MSLVVRSDVVALSTARHLGAAHSTAARSIERLSSGLRINRAADDAAGLAISEGLRSQIGGLRMGLRGAQDAISTLVVADAALSGTHTILHRLRDLTVRAMNPGTPAPTAEVTTLLEALDAVAGTKDLAGRALFDGTYTAAVQVGAHPTDTLQLAVALDGSAKGLGLAGVRGMGGTIAGSSLITGVADFGGHLGTTSTFEVAVADDDAVAALVAELADPATDVSVDGQVVDLTDVATLDDLRQALSVGAIRAEVTATGVLLTAPTNSPDLVPVTGLTGTHVPGSADVPDGGGNPASVSGTVDLRTPGGRIRRGDEELDLGAVDLSGATTPTGRAAALRAALEAAFADTTATVTDDGAFTVTTNTHLAAAFTVQTDGSALALDAIDAAIGTVSGTRAHLGATHNRLEHVLATGAVTLESLTAARGRVVDADMAHEVSALSRAQLLAQAGAALLGQSGHLDRDMVSVLLR